MTDKVYSKTEYININILYHEKKMQVVVLIVKKYSL